MMKEKNFVSVVVYVHNAENRIEKFLDSLIQLLEDNFEHAEIICVNDFSLDKSVEKIKSAGQRAQDINITVVNLSYFHGLEIVMNAGMDISIGDYVFEFDNTVIDYDISEVMKVYRRALEGFDIVSASADKKTKLSSRLFYYVYEKFAINPTGHMRTESFRILSRRVLNRIAHMNKTIPYRKAVYAYSGLKADHIVYTPVSISVNTEIDKQERQNKLDIAIETLLLFTNVGYKVSMFMFAVMLIMMVAVIIYTFIAYAVSSPVPGWTSSILFMSVAFLGLFIILSIVIKYLQLLLELVFKRQQYSFESIEKIKK